MAEEHAAARTPGEIRRRVHEYLRQNSPREAIDAAWRAFDLAADDREIRRLLAELLQHHPSELLPARRSDYLRLLTDRQIEPDLINAAGWNLLMQSHRLDEDAGDRGFESLAGACERDELMLALLREAPVNHAEAEYLITRLRRWLLLSRCWDRYPALVAALQAQARLNGGAWPFDKDERARLAEPASGPMVSAYLPSLLGNTAAKPTAADPVTRAVTTQYEGWPYPAWTRVRREKPTRLPDIIRKMDPVLADLLPVAANILVAGCGTGRQAAAVALRCPDAAVTAIDVSAASLDYGRRQCAAIGITNVRFLQLDLHAVAQLGQRFHAIHCGGVLHHLPDPERGWRLLTEVLEPAGVMRIMVYNNVARLRILGARKLLGELMQKPIDDDLLRQVRGRLLRQRAHPLAAHAVRSRDFATLAGSHDLLLHRHEDPFDPSRIKRALEALGLRLLAFDLPSPAAVAQYEAMFPADHARRNIDSWIAFAQQNFSLGNFRFWCSQASAAAA